MSDVSTIHVGVTTALGAIILLGGPMLGYIVRMRDRETRKLWEKHEELARELTAAKKEAFDERTNLSKTCHDLALQLAKLQSEVQVASKIGAKVDDLAKEVHHLSQEFAALKGELRSRRSGSSSSSIPRASDPPTPRRR